MCVGVRLIGYWKLHFPKCIRKCGRHGMIHNGIDWCMFIFVCRLRRSNKVIVFCWGQPTMLEHWTNDAWKFRETGNLQTRFQMVPYAYLRCCLNTFIFLWCALQGQGSFATTWRIVFFFHVHCFLLIFFENCDSSSEPTFFCNANYHVVLRSTILGAAQASAVANKSTKPAIQSLMKSATTRLNGAKQRKEENLVLTFFGDARPGWPS